MADISMPSYLETANLHTAPATTRVYRRTLVAADVVDETRLLFFKLAPKSKISGARAAVADVDSGTSFTWFAGITNDTLIKELIATAASPSTVGQATGVANLDQLAALGFVIPDSTWYAYIHIKDAPGTFVAGDFVFAIDYTSVLDNGA